MNLCVFTGRVGQDPEYKKASKKAQAAASFSIAVQRDYKDDEGNRPVDWIRISCYGALADFVNKYVTKGKRFLVRCHVRISEKDGEYYTNFIADSVEFADGAE